MLFLENLEQELVCALEVVCGVSEADIVLAVGSINHKVGNAVGLGLRMGGSVFKRSLFSSIIQVLQFQSFQQMLLL